MVGKKTVLLVEDSETALLFFKSLLEESGYKVITASDGIEAFQELVELIPDVIVSDLEMPNMNGYHLCRLIKAEEKTNHIPFILLTSYSDPRYKYWGMETGADMYVLKEEAQEKLLPVIKDAISKSKKRKKIEKVALSQEYNKPLFILNQLNKMLDEKLFRMTLINKITSLAFSDYQLNEMAKEIMDMCLQVLSIYSLAFTIVSHNEIKFFIHSLSSLSAENIEQFSHYCLDYLENNYPTNIDNSKIEVDYFCELKEGKNNFNKNKLYNFFKRISGDAFLSLHVLPLGNDLSNETKELIGFLLDYISITLIHAIMAERIKNLSAIDFLTHLYNRGHFMTLLNAEYTRSIRHNLNLSVIFTDIDNFKKVNDTYGHLNGDLVLKALSDTILKTIRTSDVAGRYGGEEFVIYLPETDLKNATITAERLRRNFAENPIVIDKNRSINVTISIGVASISEIDRGEPVDKLLDIADKKLYEAKEKGKNKVIS